MGVKASRVRIPSSLPSDLMEVAVSTKICKRCNNNAYEAHFDGESGYFCSDCIDALTEKFYDIFGVRLSENTTFSGLLLDPIDLERVLEVIKRNEDMDQWEIKDKDLAAVQTT